MKVGSIDGPIGTIVPSVFICVHRWLTLSRATSRFFRPCDRIASATFRARIAGSHFARAASLSPRNWSRF